ncbi:zinc finger protein 862 [Pleuronectes platessa]|uniref:zinc finger protein 862 n=1 Tax=Pleuronectes platessa TaxID=8262 RepID=UPI00232A6854|nr:zinc finger protein 862 [Pleuronectes platessa]
MFCRICRSNRQSATRGPTQRPFIEIPCTNYRRDALDQHMTSKNHSACVAITAQTSKSLSISEAFQPIVNMEHEAIIGGFKCLYWLVKHEIAHHTNYPALLDLADLLGCEYFSKLRIDQRTNYRSHKIVDDMLQILAEVVDEPISAAIKTSKAVGLEIDESTDISVLKQLDIHVRYTDKEGQLFCQFLDLVSIPDGMARTIAEAVKEVIIEKGIPQDRIYGLGTDGAAVMTGKHNGTAKLLADTWPGLVTVHCAAHRLALACKDAADGVPYMKTFRKHLQDLHLYFRNSANRTSALKAAASVLQVAALKVTVPVTIETLRQIKAAGDKQPEGSFLAQVNEKVNNLNIDAEEERVRRDRGQPTSTGRFWTKFQNEVMDPYIDRLVEHLELRFQQVSILGAFNALGPPGPQADEGQAISDLKMLAKQFQVIQEMPLLHEWQSFKVLVTTGILKDKSQLEIMKAMTSQYDELHQLYPNLSLLSAIALTIPVASVNCERDFSAMNRIKTDLRNRLQGKSLTACMKISINGPPVSKFNFSRALELFFAQPRRIACTDASCQLCRK